MHRYFPCIVGAAVSHRRRRAPPSRPLSHYRHLRRALQVKEVFLSPEEQEEDLQERQEHSLDTSSRCPSSVIAVVRPTFAPSSSYHRRRRHPVTIVAVLIYAKVFCVAREQCRQAEHSVSTSLGRASDIALANASSSGRPLFCNEDRPSAPAADFVGDHAPREGDALHEGYSGLSCGGPAKGAATHAHPPTSNIKRFVIKTRNIGRIVIVSTSRFIKRIYTRLSRLFSKIVCYTIPREGENKDIYILFYRRDQTI